MASIDRRQFLGTLAFGSAATLLDARLAFSAPSTDTRRFVLVLLRGALDGLSAVPPVGDPAYAGLRRELAIAAPGAADGALRLDSTFGLHPACTFLGERFAARELVVLHAVATPYRERSHFDGQDVLESGLVRAHDAQTGWLNRALAALPSANGRRDAGVALGQNIPLVMRGPATVASWSPPRLPDVEDDTLARLSDLYSGDPLLARRLADALATDAIAEAAQTESASSMQGSERGRTRRQGALIETVRTAGAMLAAPDGPRVAVFDTTGWDTHANEGGARGALSQRLAALDGALRTLMTSLADTWADTAVLVVTEFGRTAAMNGTRGTDHGTGAAAFLLGGAVNGGRVVADWPGLSAGALYEGRDLRPTRDVRAVFRAVLRDHLGVSQVAIDRDVFPGLARGDELAGLIRG